MRSWIWAGRILGRMASDGEQRDFGETRYGQRSDGAERKMALLRAARERGDYRLAEALADSLKDGLRAERLLGEGDGESSGEPRLNSWRGVEELPAAGR